MGELVRVQAMVPKTIIPYLKKYMKERGYDSVSQAVRRMILEYLMKYYGISLEELDKRYEKLMILKPVRV